MTTKIVTGIIDAATLASFGQAGPTIANVQIANSSYSQIDDTALSLDGGYILINGNNFSSNVQVLIDGTTATSVTYVSSSQLQAQVGAAASGSKVVYVVNNNDGATAIRVNGVTYSGTPTWITETPLPDADSGSAIAITLSANSDSNVSYSVAAGSSLPTGLTLASNGYLSGTVTIGTDTTYNFTVVATDTENQDSNKAFAITISTGDADWPDTLVLMQTDKDSFIVDGGNDGLKTTITGDPKPSSFSPYRGSYYSAHFPATSAYLTYSPAGTDSFGTGDFTVECWYYPNEVTASDILMPSATTNTWSLLTYNNQLYWKENGANLGGTGYGTVVKSAWNHLVVSRSGTTLKMFINGEQVYSATNSYDYSGAPSTRSVGPNGGGSAPYYLSNVRIVTGSALYTAAFTPPTSPLTTTSQGATASEVELLTCQSNRFIDNSSNDFALTVSGAPAVSGHVPFPFDTSDTTGSIYYDGNDYVSYGDGSATAPWNPNGDGDHTWEAWIYPITTAGGGTQIFMSTTWTSPGANFYIENAGNLRWQIYTQNSDDTSNRVPAKQWSHVAWCESSGTGYLFLNGELIESKASITNAIGYSNYFYSGARGGTSPFTGYISNMKTHQAALYTSAFTPPTSPLTATSDTSLLTHQTYYPHNNISVGDKSGGDMPLTVAGDTNFTSFTPYAPSGHSVYFDGGSDWLQTPNHTTEFSQLNSSDFTIEAWVFTSQTGAEDGIVSLTNTSSSGSSSLSLFYDGSYFAFWVAGNGGKVQGTTVVKANRWYHVALVREQSTGTNRLYVDGVLENSNTTTPNIGSGAVCGIGRLYNDNASYTWTGYISNLRISNVREYTAAFTPSTSSLVADENTILLACQDATFADNGRNRFALTINGDVRVSNFTPLGGSTVSPNTYSMAMNAHTDIATVESNTFDMSGEFTLEAWVYPTNTPSQNWGIFDARSSGGTNAYWIWYLKNVSGSLYVEMFAASGAGYVIRGATAVNLHEWTHVALTRNSSNTITVWVNGTSDATATVSTNFTVSSSSAQIGSTKDAGNGTYESNGFISNLRIVTGSAVYTTGFTPSTTPLTAVSGTQLLTCQDSTLKDNSDNNLAITTSTSTAARPSEFNPFGQVITQKVQYSPVTHGGSMYGDGTTDYVDVPAANWNSVGTGDFCIQFWTYSKEIDANKGQIAIGGNKIAIRFDSSNRMTFWVAGNGGPTSTPSSTVYGFNWYHVCLERSGSTNTLYINGVAQASNTTTPSNDTSPIIRIGGQYGNNTGYTFTGWIADLRIQSKAIYKANFLPPKQVEYGADTKLQVPFSDAAVYDGRCTVMFDINTLYPATDVQKYHSTSLSFAGVNDFVDTTERHGTTKVYADQFKLGQSDFTIEFWVRFTSLSGRQDILWIGTGGTRLGILYNLTSTHLTYYNSSSGVISATPSFSTDTWYHVALCRASGSTKLFVDGTQLGSTYTDSVNYNGDTLVLGKDSGASSSWFSGYIDGLRITKAARYTTTFTAPTAAFKGK